MNPDRLEQLIQDLLDDCIESRDLQALEAELSSNPEALARYIAYTDLENMLQVQAEVAQHRPTNVVPIERIIRRQKRRAVRIAAFSAAAILILALVTMRLFFVAEKLPTLTFETAHGTQFALTHDGSSEAPEGMVLEKGSRLQLSQGTVELTFGSGVKSIIMAPADLTLHDDDSLFLNKGTAWFHVPKEAIGFNVKTRDLDIVDLGTEFGILAKVDDHDEVHVFKGKVKATALRLSKETATLSAGQARRIDPIGLLTTLKANPSSFITRLPKSLPYLYWSFDQNDQFQVKGSHRESGDILTTGHPSAKPPSLSQGHSGQCLNLNGKKQFLVTDWPGFEGNRARTVSFWLKLHPGGDYRKPSGIVGWGNGQTNEYMTQWKIRCRQNTRGADTYLDLSLGNYHLTGTTPLADGEWHHIVVTSSGKPSKDQGPIAELYIDGQRETTNIPKGSKRLVPPIMDTDTQTKKAYPLMIGRALNENVEHHGFFRGFIDELYIYDGHMSEQDVQTMKR